MAKPNHKYPRAAAGQSIVLDASLWNQLVSDLESLMRLDVSPPLKMADGTNGKRISLFIPPGWVLLNINGTYGGTGEYQAVVVAGNPNGANLATDLNLPDTGETVPTAPIVAFENITENMAAAGTHALKTDGSVFVLGTFFGNSSDSPPIPIYRGAAGGAGGNTIQYGKLASAWTPGTNIVTLTPCTQVGGAISGATNIGVYMDFPLIRAAQWCGFNVGEIAGYWKNTDGLLMLFSNPLPRMSNLYSSWTFSSGSVVVNDYIRTG